jgi:hypothetical protein
VKKLVALIAVFLACHAQAAFEDASGPRPQLDALYERISQQFKGQCPPRVSIRESDTPGISMFNPRTAEILISRNNRKLVNTIAHETVHLCMYRLSNGASNRPEYRFIDEGYAKFYGDTLEAPEAPFIQLTMEKTRARLAAGQVSFAQVRDWPAYFGNQGKGGLLGFESYTIGASFYLFVRDTYGEARFFDLVREIGSSFTFNRALKASLGQSEEEIEA